jgi:uncharacterized surface protein with fasciclin (FAS1) repeats
MKTKLVLAAVFAAACMAVMPSAPAADRPTMYEALTQMKDHTVLYVAVTEAQEDAALKEDGNLTLYAPTDAAFKKLGAAAVKQLATDKAAVRRLVRAHLMDDRYVTKKPADYKGKELRALTEHDGKELRTLAGSSLKVEKMGDVFRVGAAKIEEADRLCSNGVIHIIDTVLPVPKE